MARDTTNPLNFRYTFGWHTIPCTYGTLSDADLSGEPRQKPAIAADNVDTGHIADKHTPSLGPTDKSKQDALKAFLYMDVANEIKRARQRAGLSQRQLAALISCQQSAISMWELGKAVPELHNRMKLAAELKINLSELMPEVVYGPDEIFRDPQVRELVENFSQLDPPVRTAVQLMVLHLRDRLNNRRAG